MLLLLYVFGYCNTVIIIVSEFVSHVPDMMKCDVILKPHGRPYYYFLPGSQSKFYLGFLLSL